MSQLNKQILQCLCTLAAGLLLAACGGGNDASPPPSPNQTSGFAVDGYLRDSAVLCDADGNGAPSSGEATVTSTSAGLFTFPDGCASGMVVTGGTNVDTGLRFVGTLKAPAGSKMVTPLTTLLVGGLTQAQLNASLGLPDGTDVTTTDPALMVNGALVNATLMKKTLAVQQLVQKTAEMLGGLQAPPDAAAQPAVYTEVAAAFAEYLKAGGKLNSSDTTLDLAIVGDLVKAAALRVGTAPALSVALRAAVNSVNADALAGVTAGGLRIQAEALLTATDAQNVAAVTKTQQSDTQITAYVAANKADLVGTPTAATVNMHATALTKQVAASQGGGGNPPPLPPGGGTVLLSFDEDPAAFTDMGAYGGALPSVEPGPSGGSGNALKILKPTGAKNDAGEVVTWGGVYFGLAPIPFTADRKKLTARVYSTKEGAVITLKVEASTSDFVEVAGTPSVKANTWTTVSWDLSAVNPSKAYKLMAITPDVMVATSGQSYFIDDITLAPAAPVIVPPPSGVDTVLATFDEVPPLTVDQFGGAISTVEAGPAGGSGMAMKINRPGGENWAGGWVATATMPFSATRKTITARVYSPTAGVRMVAKAEYAENAGTGETEATTPVVAGWQTLTWVFNSLDLSKTYNRFIVLPNLGTVGSGQSYFIDNITVLGGADVVEPPPVAGPVFLSFDEVPPAFSDMGAYGGALPSVEAGPTGGAGNALKILKPTGAKDDSGAVVPWGGVYFTTAKIPFTADNKTITARVYSTKAGAVIKFKVEVLGGGPFVEVASAPTGAANTWSTVTWVFSAVDLSKSYQTIAITPDADVVTSGMAYFIDDIKIVAGGGGGGGGGETNPGGEMGSGGPQAMTIASSNVRSPDGGLTLFAAGEGIFAGNFEGSVNPDNGDLSGWTGARTVSYPGVGNIAGGTVGYFQDDVTLSNSPSKLEENGWVSGTSIDPNAVPNFFRYFIMYGPPIPTSYMGLFANAPNNGTVDVSAFSKIKFRLWGPAEMYQKTYHPAGLEVVLAGPKVAGCGTGSGGTEIAQTFTASQTIGAASQYKLPLAGFTVKGVCGSDTNSTAIAAVLSKVARVVVTVPGTAFNFTIAVKDSSPPIFPIGLNLGAIGFTNAP